MTKENICMTKFNTNSKNINLRKNWLYLHVCPLLKLRNYARKDIRPWRVTSAHFWHVFYTSYNMSKFSYISIQIVRGIIHIHTNSCPRSWAHMISGLNEFQKAPLIGLHLFLTTHQHDYVLGPKCAAVSIRFDNILSDGLHSCRK